MNTKLIIILSLFFAILAFAWIKGYQRRKKFIKELKSGQIVTIYDEADDSFESFRIISLDRDKQVVTLSDGNEYDFDELID